MHQRKKIDLDRKPTVKYKVKFSSHEVKPTKQPEPVVGTNHERMLMRKAQRQARKEGNNAA